MYFSLGAALSYDGLAGLLDWVWPGLSQPAGQLLCRRHPSQSHGTTGPTCVGVRVERVERVERVCRLAGAGLCPKKSLGQGKGWRPASGIPSWWYDAYMMTVHRDVVEGPNPTRQQIRIKQPL